MMARMRIAKPTLLDRVVGYFAPGKALDLLRHRTMLSAATSVGQSGYHGGRRDRRGTKNWLPGGGSADSDTLPGLDDLRGRSRDLARNLPVATGAIMTNRTHVIGDGLVLNAQVERAMLGLTEQGAGEINKAIEREWNVFCKTADFTRVQHFCDLQAMVFSAALESGDVFAIRRFRSDAGSVYGTRIQILEADFVCNPQRGADTDTLVAGVEHSRDGVPIAVHVTNRHPGDMRKPGTNWRRVPMRYNDGREIVLHVFDRLRPGQTRGIPYLAPVVEALKELGSYTEAEVRAAVVSAMFTVFVKNAPNAEDGPLPTADSSGVNDKPELELAPGAVIDLAEGEDIVTANPGRPNPQFDAFVTAFLRQIGVALELPFELLIKHFTASYSASRAALEMAYHAFRRRRSWFVRRFMTPVYGWFLEEAVLTGRLDLPGFFDDPAIRDAWSHATWTGPVRMSLDPKKDAEADALDVSNGFKTRQQVMTERTGGDFEQKTEQLRRENAAREGMQPQSAGAQGPAVEDDDPDEQTDGEDEA